MQFERCATEMLLSRLKTFFKQDLQYTKITTEQSGILAEVPSLGIFGKGDLDPIIV